MTRRHLAILSFAASIAIGYPSHTKAQIRASERGSVSQTIDGTMITVDYARPQARGRTDLFGGVVHWGEVWTPGANWATNLEVNRDIAIDGHSLPAGHYSVWFQVQEEAWTAIFDPVVRRFHLMPPPESDEQIRFTVKPEEGDSHVEMLTWSFPAVKPTRGTLRLAWGRTVVDFEIGVEPSRPVTVAAAVAERYVGNYRLTPKPPLGEEPVRFDIRYENDRLVANWESPPVPILEEIWLVPLGEGMFVPAELKDGEIFDIVMDLVFEFTPLEGRANRFELRALGDQLWGEAGRQSGP
jgi:hypothetical protein